MRREEIPAEYQSDVYPLLQMSDAALQEETRRVFPLEQWGEYETLLGEKENRHIHC